MGWMTPYLHLPRHSLYCLRHSCQSNCHFRRNWKTQTRREKRRRLSSRCGPPFGLHYTEAHIEYRNPIRPRLATQSGLKPEMEQQKVVVFLRERKLGAGQMVNARVETTSLIARGMPSP